MNAQSTHRTTSRSGAPTRSSNGSPPERHAAAKSTSRSRARLSLALLFYCLGVVGVITVAPFHAADSVVTRIVDGARWFDVVANVLLFVPLGFLYPLTRRAGHSSTLRVCVTAAAVSAAIAATQLSERGRLASAVIVLANAAGSTIGALLLSAVNRRIRHNVFLAGRLSLETPLLGLIYLLIPLVLVTSLSAQDDTLRLVALVPLALLGARLLSAVQEFHFGPAGVFRSRSVAAIAAGWVVVGAFPAVLREPLVGVGLATAVALATWCESSRSAIHGTERRFEVDVLRSAVPYVAIYFIVMALLPLAADAGRWHFTLGLSGFGDDSRRTVIRLVEPLAALTVLGYMLAEWRGRRELLFRSVAPRVALECGCVAVALEGARGFQRGAGASVVQLMLTLCAGVLGARIYHNQRERVRVILVRRRSKPVSVTAA